MITASTQLCAVIGHPVDHSLSPALHNAAYASLGLDRVFTAFDVAPPQLRDALRGVVGLGLAGLSVTMPHKEAAAELCDVLDPAAAALRSVNTIVRVGTALHGYSTDGAGFVASLAEAGVAVAGMKAAVIGAGGAGRAVIDALARAGASRIVVINRSTDRAAQAAMLSPIARAGTTDDIPGTELIVNATSVGMGSVEVPIDPACLHDRHVVADIVYFPRRTALLQAAAARGATTIDGLGMLIHQAARQVELFTGERPDVMAMRAAAEAELQRRER